MNKEQQIKQIMLTIPQKVVAYDGNPEGQHLYGEQRQEIAEALYNAGYRKIDANCAVITKDELEEYKRQAVKEFAGKLKEKFYYVFGYEYEQSVSGFDTKVLIEHINETLKEYEEQLDEFADCKTCSAWSGSDCTRNPYTEGCLKEEAK